MARVLVALLDGSSRGIALLLFAEEVSLIDRDVFLRLGG